MMTPDADMKPIEKRSAPSDGGDSPSRGRFRVAHVMQVCAIEAGETEDEEPGEYFEESLQEDEVDDLQHSVEDVGVD